MSYQLKLLISLSFIISPLFSHAIELRTAAQDSAPKFIKTENQGIGGLCADVLYAVEELDPEIKFVGTGSKTISFMPVPRIEIMLENGDLDVFFCLVKNKEREAKFIIHDLPIYSSNHIIAVRREDTVQVSSFDDIRKLGTEGSILTVFGTATTDFLKEQGGLLIDEGSKTPVDTLKKLVEKRGRFFYYTDLGINTAIQEAHLEGKVRVLPAVFYSRNQYILFSKKLASEIRERVIKNVQKLEEQGKLKSIYDRYK